jgi:hypothetical protein
MALSPQMLAVLQKVEAARAEFFAGLHESAKQETQVISAGARFRSANRREGRILMTLRLPSS